MPTTLKIPSFSENNIRERTQLKTAAEAGDSTIEVESTQGFSTDDVFYSGALSREGCEKSVVLTVDDANHLTLTAPLQYDHGQFEAVTSVLGDLIHIWRAVNVDGTIPADGSFTVLATRNIDPDQVASYYTDSNGSSDFWYRSTYYNAASLEETSLTDSQPVRGDDFGHYASLTAIRAEAAFSGAVNLGDPDVDRQRRFAETEVNSALGGSFTVPFVKPVPPSVVDVTTQLAAGLLLQWAYQGQPSAGDQKVKDARAQLLALKDGSAIVDDGSGTNVTDGQVSGFDYDDDRLFTINQVF